MSNYFTKTFVAAVDIPAHRLVKFGADDNTVTLATTGTDNVIGVSDNVDVKAGNTVDVATLGIEKVQYGGTVERGKSITAGTDGKAVATQAGDIAVGYALCSAVNKDVELLGSIEAYNAVLSLTGNQNKAYTDTLYEMRNGANEFDKAYSKKLETINAQLQRGRNIMQKISIDAGNAIAPSFNKALNVVEHVLNTLDAMPEPLKKFIATSTMLSGIGLVGFGGITLAAAGVVNMFKDTLKAYRTLAFFMHKHRFTEEVKAIKAVSLAVKGLGASIMTTPIGWIAAGIAGLAVAGLLVYKYWKPLKALLEVPQDENEEFEQQTKSEVEPPADAQIVTQSKFQNAVTVAKSTAGSVFDRLTDKVINEALRNAESYVNSSIGGAIGDGIL